MPGDIWWLLPAKETKPPCQGLSRPVLALRPFFPGDDKWAPPGIVVCSETSIALWAPGYHGVKHTEKERIRSIDRRDMIERAASFSDLFADRKCTTVAPTFCSSKSVPHTSSGKGVHTQRTCRSQGHWLQVSLLCAIERDLCQLGLFFPRVPEDALEPFLYFFFLLRFPVSLIKKN